MNKWPMADEAFLDNQICFNENKKQKTKQKEKKKKRNEKANVSKGQKMLKKDPNF